MKSRPVVSIVTPAYNQAQFLPDTIKSVLEQDYPLIDYRVIDDGSTDNTVDILRQYDGRIKWESHKNCGQTTTINRGWEKAEGDILIWLNSDDTLLPGAVSEAVRYLAEHDDVGIVYGDTLFTNANGEPLNKSTNSRAMDFEEFVLRCENPIPQPSAFIRRSVIDRIGLLDPHFFYFMDWDYWLRAGLEFRLAYTPLLWSTYRLHEASNTVSQSAKAAPELEYMYKKFFSSVAEKSQLAQIRNQAMANMYFTSGGYYMKGGMRTKAARMGLRAVFEFPWLLRYPEMLHKLMFCTFGGSHAYAGFRSAYQSVRSTVGNRRKSAVL